MDNKLKFRTTTKDLRCPLCNRYGRCGFAPVEDGGILFRCWNGAVNMKNGKPIIVIKDGDEVYAKAKEEAEKPKPELKNADDLVDSFLIKRGENFELNKLSKILGITDPKQILIYRCGTHTDKYSKRWYSVPMYDGELSTIGIHLRSMSGKKQAIEGSRLGLFLNLNKWKDTIVFNFDTYHHTAFIVEGFKDAITLSDIGMTHVIGRPNCDYGDSMIISLLKKSGIKKVVIIPDKDEKKVRPNGKVYYPGQDGAKCLADKLVDIGISCKVIIPQRGKDTSDWIGRLKLLGSENVYIKKKIINVASSTPNHEKGMCYRPKEQKNGSH